MTPLHDWENLFRNEAFVNNYKTGEKITGKFAKALLEQSGLIANPKLNPDKPLVVLDNACGTGVVSSILHHELDEKVKQSWKLTCGDISEGMLEYTRRRMSSEAWLNAEIKQVDAQETKLPTGHYSHVITSFAYMALPRALTALDESWRILQPGGTLAFSTWIQPGWVPVIKRAIETHPDNLPWPTTEEFLTTLGNGEWNSPRWIESQLRHRGLEDIHAMVITKSISLSVAELVEMTMIMIPMVAKHFWTEDQREKSSGNVRPALEKYLEDTYGKEGQVPMEWTAILSTARKPVHI
ncbi:uncharacterized protein N7459_009082 [Penicillium hispanicum]|uniref:uncharacterized protein n=1 Tax=Penicillium hispanicum TaxID=1080232 RepID=UPI002540B879|nr:uncharacterized protein N7459_009082 [Penicillium hispanicum]KAJ5569652.1 hypothetical protein N7459_009082 [Penicillium hispanicum]